MRNIGLGFSWAFIFPSCISHFLRVATLKLSRLAYNA